MKQTPVDTPIMVDIYTYRLIPCLLLRIPQGQQAGSLFFSQPVPAIMDASLQK